MKVTSVVGARPQFIKAAIVSAALKDAGITETMIHTGQHYDYEMSALFFEQLAIDAPAHNLGVGSSLHGAQTARILEGVETILVGEPTDMLLVYGDTNSTLAGALAAAKLHVPVAHVEAGLRSFNRRMPEEINRVLTDHMSDLLFVPTDTAVANLKREGIAPEKIRVTGDVMYDAILKFRALFERERPRIQEFLKLKDRGYFLVTVHRAENTDEEHRLRAIVTALDTISREVAPVVWLVHPRTRRVLRALALAPEWVQLAEPLGYIETQALIMGARGVLTDSGGLQKEAAFHGCPVVTLRDETEWTETVTSGANVLVGADCERIVAAARGCTERVQVPAGFGRGDAGSTIAGAIRTWAARARSRGPFRDESVL